MCTRQETGTEEEELRWRQGRSEVAGSGRDLPLKGPEHKNNNIYLHGARIDVYNCLTCGFCLSCALPVLHIVASHSVTLKFSPGVIECSFPSVKLCFMNEDIHTPLLYRPVDQSQKEG